MQDRQDWSGDLVIVGGGVAGCVAGIAAARLGLRVALLHNRPVLGGPSSTECSANADGSFVCGASEYVNANAREGGILEELKAEARYRRSVGYEQHWSLLLREWVEREPNLELRMNTEAFDLEMAEGRIRSVTGRTLESGLTCRYAAPLFIDCSGDAFVGHAAGAEFRHGREGRSEFGESLAPEAPDRKTMGSSIAFRAVDTGQPVPFEPPPWAMTFRGEEDFRFRPHGNPRQGYWWLEYGGELDTIADNEAIYRKLLRVLFGVWDHVKNHGDHGAANYAIQWVSSLPAKRESRRLTGDHLLTQRDVEEHPAFPDAVAYGGWPIDLHPPEGFFAQGHPGSSPPFHFPGLYPIPFRCLYSRNVPNLMMAGRNASVTHVALGTTRVMGTCALLGQAVGTAAFLCRTHGLDPREVGQRKIRALQTLLGREDAALPEVRVILPDNLAPAARIAADSAMTLGAPAPVTGTLPLVAPPRDPARYDPADPPPADRRRAQMFPVSEPRLERLTLYFDNRHPTPVEVPLTLHRSRAYNDFGETPILAAAAATVAPGRQMPAVFELGADVEPGALHHVVLGAVEGVDVCVGARYLPGLYRKADGSYPVADVLAFATDPPQRVFEPSNAVNGLARAGAWPNAWLSDPRAELPQRLTLTFEAPARLAGVELLFDTNLHKAVRCGVPPECVRDYQVHLRCAGEWRLAADVTGNRQRRRRHALETVAAEAVQLTVLATHGDPSARVYELRVFRAAD